MNQRNKIRSAILAIALLFASAGSSSMTLGKAHGAVLLGQPLKLTVPIQLDAGQGSSALCFDAEVFFGDTRQDPSRIVVSSDHIAQTQSANVYVTSTSQVDEPVVSVYLNAGCEAKTARRFVLLADLESATVTRIAQASLVVKPIVPAAVLQTQAAAIEPVAIASRTQGRVLREGDLAQAPLAPVRLVPKVGTPRPRLKLLPVDLTQVRDPSLKLSNELHLGESENLQKRAEAMALWKSLNTTPQDILTLDEQRQSMEADIKGLQVSTEKNSQTLLELNGRLQSAMSQRYANPLVYVLAGIPLLFSVGLAYFLLTGRRVELARLPWWRTEDSSDNFRPSATRSNRGAAPPQEKLDGVQALDTHQHALDAPAVSNAVAVTEVDIDLQLEEPSGTIEREVERYSRNLEPDAGLNRLAGATGHADFAHSMTTSLRALNTQEMLDVRQQADFFMTLGQHDEALRLLKNCIDSNLDSNPLVYLDLLRVLHTLGRKVEFDHYRLDFNALFSGHIPLYAAFNQGGDGLEAYPEICHEIESFWPSEQAVGYIEKCLLRNVGDGTTRSMDLEAFRDLLMLHGTAKRIDSSSESGLMPFITAKATPSEVGAIYVPGLDDFELHEKTQQGLIDAVRLGDLSVDLELPTQPGNLIDFDPSDLSLPDPHQARKS